MGMELPAARRKMVAHRASRLAAPARFQAAASRGFFQGGQYADAAHHGHRRRRSDDQARRDRHGRWTNGGAVFFLEGILHAWRRATKWRSQHRDRKSVV